MYFPVDFGYDNMFGCTAASEAKVKQTMALAIQPENIYCHNWQPGDLVVVSPGNNLLQLFMCGPF
jgi:hypothetical protein